MDLIWISVIIGGILGFILSVLFGVYSKATADSYVRTLFGISSSTLIMNGILLFVVAGFVFLAACSFVIRDTWYPVTMPANFTIEVLAMAILPALTFLLMPYLRGYSYTSKTFLEFFILMAKFGLLQVLLQFSGFYSTLFPPLVKGARRV